MKELFDNQFLKVTKQSSQYQQYNQANLKQHLNNKSPTAMTNVTHTTGTMRHISKANDAAVYHGSRISKRIVFTHNEQKANRP